MHLGFSLPFIKIVPKVNIIKGQITHAVMYTVHRKPIINERVEFVLSTTDLLFCLTAHTAAVSVPYKPTWTSHVQQLTTASTCWFQN